MHSYVSLSRNDEKGFSLPELVVALAMSGFVLAAGVSAIIVSQKGAQATSRVSNTQAAARSGLDLLTADLKLAGFGTDRLATPVGNCQLNGTPSAIVPSDNNIVGLGADTGPDAISMVVPLTDSIGTSGAIWQMANPVPPGFTQVLMPVPAITAMQQRGLVLGSVVSLGGAAPWIVTGIVANALNFGVPFDSQVSLGAGTLVYLLQCITYQVIPPPDANNLCNGNAPCLVRGVAPGIPLPGNTPDCNVPNPFFAPTPHPCLDVMDGVEDLQLAYACDGCDPRPTSNAVGPGVPDGQMDDLDQSGNFNLVDFISNRNWFLTAAPYGNYMTTDKIHLVWVSIVARQLAADQGVGETNMANIAHTSGFLQVSDHNHANGVFAANDVATVPQQQAYFTLRRRVMTRTVEVRNQRT